MEVEQLQDGDLKYGPGTAYRHASAQGGGGGGGSGKKGKKGPSKGKAKSKSKVKPKDKGIMLNPSSAVNVGPWIVKHANPAGRTPAELHELGYGTIVFTDDAEVKQTAEVGGMLRFGLIASKSLILNSPASLLEFVASALSCTPLLLTPSTWNGIAAHSHFAEL